MTGDEIRALTGATTTRPVDDWDDDRYWRPRGATGPPPARLEPAKTGRMGSRRLGSLHEITVGCSVWARTEGPDQRLTANQQPAGGIVLEIIDTRHADPDTGELTAHRAFRCYDPWTDWPHAFTTLPERCVEPDSCETTTPDVLARAARRFAAHAAQSHGPLTPSDARLLRDANHLTATLLGAAT